MKKIWLMIGLLFGYAFGAQESKESDVSHEKNGVTEIQFPFWIKMFTANERRVVAAGEYEDLKGVQCRISSHNLKTKKQKSFANMPSFHTLALSPNDTVAVMRSWGLQKRVQFLYVDASESWQNEGTRWQCGIAADDDGSNSDAVGTLHSFSNDTLIELYKSYRQPITKMRLTVYSKPWAFWPMGTKKLVEKDLMTFEEGKEPVCVATTAAGELVIGQQSGDILFYDQTLDAKNYKVLANEPNICAIAAAGNWVATTNTAGKIKRWDRRKPDPELVAAGAPSTKSLSVLEDGTIIAPKNDKMLLWSLTHKASEDAKS